MAGKQGRSGPPGNLNACRHPWKPFWTRRVLRPEDRWVVAVMDRYLAGLHSDKPDMTEGEKRTAEIAMAARGCWLMALAQASRDGIGRITDKGWDFTPGMKAVPQFMSIERGALTDIGLQRRAKRADSILDIPVVDGGE